MGCLRQDELRESQVPEGPALSLPTTQRAQRSGTEKDTNLAMIQHTTGLGELLMFPVHGISTVHPAIGWLEGCFFLSTFLTSIFLP